MSIGRLSPRGETGDQEKGQGLVEYVLILVLVSVALLVALTAFSGGLSNAYSLIVSKLP